jgi:hypothetical protein
LITPTPLRKRTLKGDLYTRPPEIEGKLLELSGLPREEAVTRCKIPERDDPAYVPSECLLHFVRSFRENPARPEFEVLYRLLATRLLRKLPRDSGRLDDTLIREEVFGRFCELLAEDLRSYSERLDFFEIRFDKAFKRVLMDAQPETSTHSPPQKSRPSITGLVSTQRLTPCPLFSEG